MIFSNMPRQGFLALCVLALFVTPARADVQTIKDSNSAIWGAAGASLFNYAELIAHPNIPDSEHGWLTSLALGGSYMAPKSRWYTSLQYAENFGHANYNGSVRDNATGFYDIPYQTTTNETRGIFDAQFGRGFAFGNSVMLTPYVDFGSIHWGRDVTSSMPNVATVTENYDSFDVLGGAMVQVSPIDRLVLSLYGAAGTTLGPQMETGGLKFTLGDSGVYKVGGKIGYDVSQRVEIFTTIDYDAYRFVNSPLTGGVAYEPTSKTEDTTLRVGVAYHYL